MAKEIEKETRELGKGKLILIIIAVFIIVPLSFLSLVYFTNENFKFIANASLSKMPGWVGQYFSRFPTKEEREAQKREVAMYLVELDVGSASDKLMLIKKEDSKLYSELLKIMMQIDSAKTEQVLERIRDASLKKDVLASTLEQIRKDHIKDLESRAKYYESLPLPDAVSEINDDLLGSWYSYQDMGRIIEYMNENNAAKILKNLEQEVAANLLSKFESAEKSKKVEEIMQNLKSKQQNLIDIAQAYNEKKPETLLNEIGNTQKYKLDALSTIYRNMSIEQSAKVISQIEDQDFVFQLIEQIKSDERLGGGEAVIADDLMRTVKIYQDHNKKVDKLAKIYSKMDENKLGKIIAELFNSNNTGQRYILKNGETITITDQDLAVGILERLQPKKAGEVLDTLDIRLASQISKRFTLVPYGS